MSAADNPRPKKALAIRLLGWITGGLSVLNLIKDTTPLQLYGLVREWSDAYARLVEKIGAAVFGWINWSWIRIDNSENHVILIAIIIGSSLGRASHFTSIRKGKQDSIFKSTVAGITLIGGLFVFLMAMIPSPWGVIIGLAFEFLLLLIYIFGKSDDIVDTKDFRKEILVVLAGFVILILANYFIFKPA